MFLIGNFVSLATVLFEISELAACVAEGQVGSQPENDEAEDKIPTASLMLLVLLWGTVLDVLSAIIMSCAFCAPLSIKSAHVLVSQGRHTCVLVVMGFLSCVSWTVLFFAWAFISAGSVDDVPCSDGEVGGARLESYLTVSGFLMIVVGCFALFCLVVLTGASMLIACLTLICCNFLDAEDWMDACGTTGFLRLNVAFDWLWKVQGTILSYRKGSVGLGMAVFLGFSGTLGEVVGLIGSSAAVAEFAEPVVRI